MAQVCAANFSGLVNREYSSKTYQKIPRVFFWGILENEIYLPDVKKIHLFESKIQFFLVFLAKT